MNMHTCQWEIRIVMIECDISPHVRRVARRTIMVEVPINVIGVLHTLIVILMT